jgi:probable phosphoglycerate mutase
MQERAVGTIDALVERHRGESFVAVSHADPIKAVVASAAGTPLDLFQRFVIAPCSVSAIAYGEDGPSVLCTSSTASLDEAGLV